MALGDVVDKLHNQHRLTHTGTTEETDLTTLRIGLQKVNHLDACGEHLSRECQFIEGRCRLVYRTQILTVERSKLIDSLADHIQQASLYLVACGHSNRTPKVKDLHTAAHTIGALHCHTAHSVFTYVLLHFENQLLAILTLHFQSGVNRGDIIFSTLE